MYPFLVFGTTFMFLTPIAFSVDNFPVGLQGTVGLTVSFNPLRPSDAYMRQ